MCSYDFLIDAATNSAETSAYALGAILEQFPKKGPALFWLRRYRRQFVRPILACERHSCDFFRQYAFHKNQPELVGKSLINALAPE